MATINYRLQKIAEDLFIKYGSDERKYIDERIQNFQRSIKDYFGGQVNEILLFGSYMRDTILPRKRDEHSDIDVLVVFDQAEKERTPETYRNQLRRFASTKYFSTKVLKDHPSIVLEMKDIKFDLVPARFDKGFFFDNYQIPSKTGNWMDTDPLGFTQKLTRANNNYKSIVKPIIRLMKRWNACNNYPYPSFILEQIVADMNFYEDNFQTGFLHAINKLPTYDLPDYQARKVNALKSKREWIKKYLERDNQQKAEELVLKILAIG